MYVRMYKIHVFFCCSFFPSLRLNTGMYDPLLAAKCVQHTIFHVSLIFRSSKYSIHDPPYINTTVQNLSRTSSSTFSTKHHYRFSPDVKRVTNLVEFALEKPKVTLKLLAGMFLVTSRMNERKTKYTNEEVTHSGFVIRRTTVRFLVSAFIA